MFTKTELVEKFDSLTLGPLPSLLKWQEIVPIMESRSSVLRGSMSDFDTALQFYFCCVTEEQLQTQHFDESEDASQNWTYNPSLDDGLFQPISQELVERKTRECLSGTKQEVDLPSPSDFEEAMLMSDDWDDILLLARFKHEFVFIYWFTVA